jgi:hypothetical protein
MRRRATALWVVASSLVTPLLLPGAAFAAPSGSGSDGGGTVTVGAGDGGATVGIPGVGSERPGSTAPTRTGGSAGSPWSCSDQALALNDEGFPPGGTTPGGWFSVTCTDSLTGATTTTTEWIADLTTPVPTVVAVDPQVLAFQAEESLSLPRPVTHFSPVGQSVVNLPTWLWVDAGAWHAETVSVTAGTVSVTAVATPKSVSWSMGDGAVVTCAGPGVPYQTSRPALSQTTDCDYTYATTSAGQPSADGNQDDGAFTVTATIAWSVAWTATGAPGGGALPGLNTSASTRLRVEQIESISGLSSFRPVEPTGRRRQL